MADDRDVIRRAIDVQQRARDVRFLDLPAYRSWSQRKLREGISDALVAHLDATGASMLPEDAARLADADFDELLADLIAEFGE